MMFYAACGLVLSFVVNVVSFTTVQVGDNAFFTGLFWGIFPAFFSVILIGSSERKKIPEVADEEIDYWELAFAGCPRLLKWVFWACFAYAFALGLVLAIWQPHAQNVMWRGGSAFCMTFYAMGLTAVTGAYLRRRASYLLR
jgi:hypothetical protein